MPDALDAALALGRLDEGAALVALLAEQPPGHIPPYLAAHLARGRGLVAAVEGGHDAVETDLGAAIDGFRELGYPYWLASPRPTSRTGSPAKTATAMPRRCSMKRSLH